MAGDQPLLGFGMDGYRLTFPHFASMRYVRIWGYDLQVTGPHNTFMAHLYWGGWPALLAFVAVVVLAGVAFVRGVRRLRDRDLGDLVLPLAAVAVASLGYLLVESFNVERLELAALFWFGVGLLVAASAGETSATAPAPVRRARGRSRAAGDAWGLAAAVVVALVLLVWTTGPWRADNSLRAAGIASGSARELASSSPQLAAARSQASRDDIDAAVSASPWEARYLRVRADAAKATAPSLQQQGRTAEAASVLQRAAADYARARRLTPHDPALVGSSADVLYRLADVSGDSAPAERATALLAREVRWEPRNGRLRGFLGVQRIAHGQQDAGVRDLDAAAAMFPKDKAVLGYAETGYRAAGLTAKADEIAARLKKLG
jgi:hypothetical protein